MPALKSRTAKYFRWKASCDFAYHGGLSKRFQRLPFDIQEQAQQSCQQWRINPQHTSLDYKRVSQMIPLYSIRIELHWRALAPKDADTRDRFWIGPHSQYDKLLDQPRWRECREWKAEADPIMRQEQDANKSHLTVLGRILAFVGACAVSALDAVAGAAAGMFH